MTDSLDKLFWSLPEDKSLSTSERFFTNPESFIDEGSEPVTVHVSDQEQSYGNNHFKSKLYKNPDFSKESI